MGSLLRYFMVSLFLAFAACASQGGGYVQDITALPPGKGLVIFSTGADSTNLVASTRLLLVNGDSHKKYDRVLMNFDYPFPSDFMGEHANLRTLILPEGTYYLFPEMVNTTTMAAPIYRFSVRSGEVAYLGSLTLKVGRRIVFSNMNQRRDVGLFVSKNRKFTADEIKVRYMEFDSRYSLGDQERFKIKGIIFGAP